MDTEQFKQALQRQGYGEPQPLEFGPNATSEMHTHDASCFVLVLDGELTLLTEQGAKVYRPGDSCEIRAGTPHPERTGASGTKTLIGRK